MIISHAVEILQYVDCRKSLGSRGTENVAKKKLLTSFTSVLAFKISFSSMVKHLCPDDKHFGTQFLKITLKNIHTILNQTGVAR